MEASGAPTFTTVSANSVLPREMVPFTSFFSLSSKNAKLRGVASFGMICAAVEIGLSDLFPCDDDHGIMDITHIDAPAGTPLAKALDLDDMILEIRHLAVRADCRGQGLAQRLLGMLRARTGGQKCTVWARQGNTPAERFYEKNDFRPDGWTSVVLRLD